MARRQNWSGEKSIGSGPVYLRVSRASSVLSYWSTPEMDNG